MIGTRLEFAHRLRRLFPHSSNSVGENDESVPSSSSAATAISVSPNAVLPTLSEARSPSCQIQSRAPVPNARSRHLLSKAIQLLKEHERAIIQKYILPSTVDVKSALKDVLDAVREKKKICNTKRWTFTIRGRIIRLKEEADKVVSWLDRFKQVGDIAVNADPIHAGLP